MFSLKSFMKKKNRVKSYNVNVFYTDKTKYEIRISSNVSKIIYKKKKLTLIQKTR